MPLTDAQLRKLQPADKTYRLSDGGGMYIEITPSGGKWWRLKYRFHGREKRLSLGTYPIITLADARDRRYDAKKLLAQGIDPGAQRKAAKAARQKLATDTVEFTAREWLEVKKHDWTQGQLDKETRRLENHVFPWIGKLPVDAVGVPDIRPLVDRLIKQGHLEQAHRVRFQLARVFKYAIATERTTRNPAAELNAVMPTRRKRNYAAITEPAEVGALLRAIDGFDGTFTVGRALKLAPLLFVRPGELRAAEWTEFDLDNDCWYIPPVRRKLRRAAKEDPATPPHLVPLSRQVVAILRELERVTGGQRLVFPSLRGRGRPMSENTINAALRRLGFDKHTMTGHGFRHMASTLLNEMGFNSDAIERQLAHKEPGVRGVYNQAEHLAERIRMMQAWADYLDRLRGAGAIAAPQARAAMPDAAPPVPGWQPGPWQWQPAVTMHVTVTTSPQAAP